MFLLLLIVSSVGFGACLRSDFVANVASSIDPKAQLWAVLVAGSSYWFNYRHQADICHAYQILHNHGIPDERIIVMMEDDIARNPSNPTPGIIINHPNGKDVYHGVLHDYTHDDVTPKNFLNILEGNVEAMKGIGSGKVLRSGPNDHVFIYYADHGAPGILGFPREYILGARQLMNTLKKMHRENKYKKMVIYVEACCSGSMFKNILPDNINIFATTAANSTESSYTIYYDDKRHTYLGDVYSVNWMEDSDKENLLEETLSKQYTIVKEETNTSHVKEFGDLSMGKMPVGEFQGRKQTLPIMNRPVPMDAIPSGDVPLEILKRKLMKATDFEERSILGRKLIKLLKNREFLHNVLKRLVRTVVGNEEVNRILTTKQEIKNFDCYEDILQHFNNECFDLNKNNYVFGQLYILVNMCENNIPSEVMKNAMDEVCTHPPVYGIL